MQINYELDAIESTVRQQIESKLRAAKIPYLLEEEQLLIHKVDERAVDEIISQLATVDNPAASPSPRSPYVDDKPVHPLYRETRESSRRTETTKPLKVMTKKGQVKNDDFGPISLAGAIIGAAFGVLVVVAAFLDPNFEGRVYLFLPAIIFGAIGSMLGNGIEKVIHKLRRK